MSGLAKKVIVVPQHCTSWRVLYIILNSKIYLQIDMYTLLTLSNIVHDYIAFWAVWTFVENKKYTASKNKKDIESTCIMIKWHSDENYF